MLSTIILTYDQPELTAAHVKYCRADEIVVVNDGGREDIFDAVKSVGKHLIYARVTKDIPWNTQGAKNLGIFLASNKVISIEDCDHIPYPDYYWRALEAIEAGADRVLGSKRAFIRLADLSKDMEEWKPYRGAGAHTMIGMYTREILARMKGFDERFAGHYGWDGADLNRRLGKLDCNTVAVSGFYMITDGESGRDFKPRINGKPKMEKENGGQLIRNKREGGQVEHPILNFNYEITRI